MLGEHLGGQSRQCLLLALLCLAFERLARTGLAMLFPRIEHQMQPRHHLVERRHLAGGALFATRARISRLALRARFTGETLLAAFALRTGFADRTGLAARTLRTGTAGMALWAGLAGFARRTARADRTLLSLSCYILGHWLILS